MVWAAVRSAVALAAAVAVGVAIFSLRASVFMISVAWERLVTQPSVASLNTQRDASSAQKSTAPPLPDAAAASTTSTSAVSGGPRVERGSRGRVAVVGGGIAGCGAGWALARDGFEVHLFEAEATLGGNAKTHTWPDDVTTGLSVLAWPSAYFANYQKLLETIGVQQVDASIGFYIRDSLGRDFEHGNAK